MSIPDGFERVSPRLICPVCEKPDWCLVEVAEGTVRRALCQRKESPRRWREAGYLHIVAPGSSLRSGSPRARIIRPAADFSDLDRQARECVGDDDVAGLARQLGVSTESLRGLGVGWLDIESLRAVGFEHARSGAWTFPMRNRFRRVTGLRIRFPGGKKLCVRKSNLGLVWPEDISRAPRLFIAEGESDTAALLTLGAFAIGRPGASTCVELAAKVAVQLRAREVVVVADADEAGRAGADRLLRALKREPLRAVLWEPPAKDVRAWLQDSATRAAFDASVNQCFSTRGGAA